MKESPLSPLISTAKGYLDEAQERLKLGRRPGLAVAYGLDLLTRLLTDVERDLAEREIAEVAVVYDTLAGQVADVFGITSPEAFRLLVELCDDEEARLLLTDQPEPSVALLAQMRSRLVWVTVTYQAPPGGRCRRSAEIVYKGREGAPVSRKVTQELVWEDLPDRARERLLTGVVQTVRYQLYPAVPQH
jgi:hypothetical protein